MSECYHYNKECISETETEKTYHCDVCDKTWTEVKPIPGYGPIFFDLGNPKIKVTKMSKHKKKTKNKAKNEKPTNDWRYGPSFSVTYTSDSTDTDTFYRSTDYSNGMYFEDMHPKPRSDP